MRQWQQFPRATQLMIVTLSAYCLFMLLLLATGFNFVIAVGGLTAGAWVVSDRMFRLAKEVDSLRDENARLKSTPPATPASRLQPSTVRPDGRSQDDKTTRRPRGG